MTDHTTQRLVALLIGLVALAAVIGTIVLLAQGQAESAALVGLGGTALGYLAGLVTPSPGQHQPTRVVGPDGGAVPTVEVDPL
jgi:hypothetical protein